MSRRLLIVSPHFPPANAPDMHRIRLSLPAFVAAGWRVTVLTVADPTPGTPLDPELAATVPPAVEVVRARAFSATWTRRLGVGNLALRAWPFLFLAGCRLLLSRRYDVVYFSTTQFIVMPLGRIWKQLARVPYVIDLQDPWANDYYFRPGAPRAPGGWKYLVVHLVDRLLEGWTLRGAAHVVTVSEQYRPLLVARHPALRRMPFTVQPFGAPESDFPYVRQRSQSRARLLPAGRFNLVFAGAVGPGMTSSVDALLAAVAELRREGCAVEVHFFGTSYAGPGHAAPVTAALAARHGIADVVHERPSRLAYFDALQVTCEADANLLFGSTDLGFVPSKLVTLLAAARPIVAVAHAGSALVARLTEWQLPHVALAGAAAAPAEIRAIAARLGEIRRAPSTPPAPLPPELRSDELARRQLGLLDHAAGQLD